MARNNRNSNDTNSAAPTGRGLGYHAAAPNSFSIAQTIPGGSGYIDSVISTQGNNLGDTVYYLVSNIFDPRVLRSATITPGSGGAEPTVAFGNTYSTIAAGYAYTDITYDYLYRLLFDVFRMRNAPDVQVILDIIANIADISRMIGIFATAMTMMQSRDPEMFQRARLLQLNNTFAEMASMLERLPIPTYILKANLKYIRLMDVAGIDNYQNVGFLVNGDYQAFLTLAANVRSRPLALNYMNRMYKQIGRLGDPASGYDPDVMQAFVNANYKLGPSNVPYVRASGATKEPEQMASYGMLGCTIESSAAYTVTGWAVPGSGFGSVANFRSYIPFLCRWNGTSDAGITRDLTQTYSAATVTAIAPQLVLDVNLAANIAHEYNMAYDNSSAARTTKTFNATTGAITLDTPALATEDVRYRVGSDFSLGFVSYKLDGNILTGLYDCVAS